MSGPAAQALAARRPSRARVLVLLTAGVLVGHALLLRGLPSDPAAPGLSSTRADHAVPGRRLVWVVIAPLPAAASPGVAPGSSRPMAAADRAPAARSSATRAPAARHARSLDPGRAGMAPPAAAPLPQAGVVTPGAGSEPAASGPAVAPDPAPASARAPDPPPAGTDVSARTDGRLPDYPAALPPDFHTRLAVWRAGSGGEGWLQFARDPDGRYRLQLSVLTPGRPRLDMASQGRLGAGGLVPERFTDRRQGRGASAANFDPLTGTVRFSTGAAEAAIGHTAQDRLSWLVQLGAVVGADPRLQQPDAQVLLQVVGARGGVQLWRFRSDSPGEPSGDGPPVDGLLRFVREPEQPYDLRVEAWLDPARQHRVVRARLTPVPTGQGLEFRAVEDQL